MDISQLQEQELYQFMSYFERMLEAMSWTERIEIFRHLDFLRCQENLYEIVPTAEFAEEYNLDQSTLIAVLDWGRDQEDFEASLDSLFIWRPTSQEQQYFPFGQIDPTLAPSAILNSTGWNNDDDGPLRIPHMRPEEPDIYGRQPTFPNAYGPTPQSYPSPEVGCGPTDELQSCPTEFPKSEGSPNKGDVPKESEEISPGLRELRERLEERGSDYRGYITSYEDSLKVKELYLKENYQAGRANACQNFPRDDEGQCRLVQRLCTAITNTENIFDGQRMKRLASQKKTNVEENENPRGQSAGSQSEPRTEFVDSVAVTAVKALSPIEVELLGWDLLYSIKNAQEGLMPIPRWGKDWHWKNQDSFMARFNMVVETLQRSKSSVKSLLAVGFMERLVAEPERELRRKVENKEINFKRDAQNKVAIYAMDKGIVRVDENNAVFDDSGREIAPGNPIVRKTLDMKKQAKRKQALTPPIANKRPRKAKEPRKTSQRKRRKTKETETPSTPPPSCCAPSPSPSSARIMGTETVSEAHASPYTASFPGANRDVIQYCENQVPQAMPSAMHAGLVQGQHFRFQPDAGTNFNGLLSNSRDQTAAYGQDGPPAYSHYNMFPADNVKADYSINDMFWAQNQGTSFQKTE